MRCLVCVMVGSLGLVLAAAQEPVDTSMLARITAEAQQRSRVLRLFHTITDELGARLSGSPAYDAAARWARERFAEWGLANAQLEPFEFGRGWTLEKISVEMTAPRYMPMTAYPDAWTSSVDAHRKLTSRAR